MVKYYCSGSKLAGVISALFFSCDFLREKFFDDILYMRCQFDMLHAEGGISKNNIRFFNVFSQKYFHPESSAVSCSAYLFVIRVEKKSEKKLCKGVFWVVGIFFKKGCSYYQVELREKVTIQFHTLYH